jgi:hypothetical protein
METLGTVAHALLWLLALFQGLLICFLVRQLSDLRELAEKGQGPKISQLPRGSTAPEFSGITLTSSLALHSSMLRGKRTVLLFLSTDCGICRKLAHELGTAAHSSLEGLVILCQGEQRVWESRLAALSRSVPVLLPAQDVIEAYRLSGFPAVFIVDAAWRIVDARFPSLGADVLDCLSEPEAAVREPAMQAP